MSSVTDTLITSGTCPSYHSTNNDQVSAIYNVQIPREQSVLVDMPPDTPSATCNFKPDFPVDIPTTKNRLVDKNGSLRVKAMKVPDKAKLYLADLFTTAIDLRWHWVMALFCVSYIFSWIFFAMLWWFMVLSRGKGVCVSEVGLESINI